MWAIYAVFLLFKAGVLLVLKNYVYTAKDATEKVMAVCNNNGAVERFYGTLANDVFSPKEAYKAGYDALNEAAKKTCVIIKDGEVSLPDTLQFLSIFIKDSSNFANNDTVMLIVLVVVAILILAIMVFGGKYVTEWIEKEKLESSIEAKRNTAKKADEMDKIQAERLKKQ